MISPEDCDRIKSLASKWHRLADSWIKSTKGMDDFDDCRVRAVARANAYRDCANELIEQIKDQDLERNQQETGK